MDHLKDNLKRNLYRMYKEGSLPDFVRNYEIPESAEDLDNADFADPVEREFPVHTKEDTYLSACYAKEASEDLRPEVKDKLNKYLKFWNLDEEFQEEL